MREYLDTESDSVAHAPVALLPVLRDVVEHLSPVAHERQVRLRLTGACNSTIALAEPRLRLALRYLVGTLITKQPRPGDVSLRLEEGPSETRLRMQGVREALTPTEPRHDPSSATLHRVQLAIARRLLESAGASLVFRSDDCSDFTLRIPRSPRPVSPELIS